MVARVAITEKAAAMLERLPQQQQGALAMRDELTLQLASPPPAYVLVSAAGVLELEKRRPVGLFPLV